MPDTENEPTESEAATATDPSGEPTPPRHVPVGELAEERKARKAAEKELAALRGKVRAFEERDQTEIEKRDTRIKELEALYAESQQSLSAKDIDILRRDVARDKGVPVSAVTGSTREEMEKSADDLIEWRGNQPGKKAPVGFQSGASAPSGANEKEKAAAAIRAMRRGN